ncbi:hypothetical protein MKX01_008463 [Papaver californicum]|nr:hypothetical protein MKX01_008463 [Papaver californicum]
MKYKAIFSNTFSRHEQKKLGYGAFVGCLIILLTSFSVYKSSFTYFPLDELKQDTKAADTRIQPEIKILHSDIKFRSIEMKQEISIQVSGLKKEIKVSNTRGMKREPVCDVSNRMTDFCDINGDVRIHGKTSTVLFNTSSQNGIYAGNEPWKVKPYPRKIDINAMSSVSQFSVQSFINSNGKEVPQCSFSHNVPAIIFSTAGYSWNHFHAYTDIFIPIFLTSHMFNKEVQFLITNSNRYWIYKYKVIFQHLSRYPIIDIDNEDNVHCYKRVIVGLKVHKDFDIDPTKSPEGYSMTDFTKFLRSAYSLNSKSSAITISKNPQQQLQQPRLLLVSRKKSRKFINEDEIVTMAESLGYEVIVAEPGNGMDCTRFAEVVSTCDVMLGVHGAGLTNIVFLPVNAILIQIVPLGGLETVCRNYFGEPAKDMKLRYLEYKISVNESSLIEQYPLDHVVFRDPLSISKLGWSPQGWSALRSVYLDKQDVHIDVHRFRPTLLKALQLLRS